MRKKTASRYWVFIIVVFVYIIASFVWWAYLLHRNNYENFHEVINREQTAFMQQGGTVSEFRLSKTYLGLENEFRRTEMMLYGEGLVFISLISLGFWRIRKTFREEIALTRQQNNFLLSITHELKSPLASLKLSMQTIRKRQLDEDRVRNMAAMSLDDIERLELLVENILLASKLESQNFRLNRELIDLSTITRGILDNFTMKYKAQRTFTDKIDKDVYIYADRFSFSTVVYNLIENAIKYSSQGSEISVALTGDEQYAYLQVADNGIGIPAQEKERIFDRFYRIGTEETRKTKGTGLGLFIVKQVVLMHNGMLEVKDVEPHGSRFEIRLPVGA